MRKYFLAGNWKMNLLSAEAAELAKALVDKLGSCGNKLMLAPTFTSLAAVADVVKGSNILLGAQNMSSEESGAHTGEISVHMLKDMGVSVVILGHSERRLIYGETDEFINKKVKLALAQGLEVVLCVGETLEQREAGKADDVVIDQLKNGLAGIPENDLKDITIAYEPVWAIGTGKTATPEDADAIHSTIRNTLKSVYSNSAAENMVIQYGGSVKPENVKSLMAMENIDGALVGGASLKVDSFTAIAEFDK